MNHINLSVTNSAGARKTLTFLRNWTLPISMICGIAAYFLYVNIPLFDSTHKFVGEMVDIIQPMLIFTMLFLTFLSIGPRDLHLRKWHLWHSLIQIALFGCLTLLLTYFADGAWRLILESAMLCLLCPTATAAAVVTRKLDGNPADITTYTIIINIAIAIAAPALLPIAHPHEGLTFFPTFCVIISKVFPLLILPLVAAWLIRQFAPKIADVLRSYKDLPFYLWAVALAIAIAVTVKAIVHSQVPVGILLAMGVATIACCLLQFYLGKKIGSHYGESIEGGQALGQKNTVFIIWLGYTFLSPVTAVAGGLYSVWHNVFNSYQLYKKQKSDKEADT